MEQDILNKLAGQIDAQDKKLDEIYKTMHRLQDYFRWTFIITIIFFVLPLIGLLFVIPQFFSLYGGLGELGL